MLRRRNIIIAAILVIILLPLWMWLAWLLTPKKKLVTAIVDKTVLTKQGQEHLSLSWVLNQERFTKTSSKLYDISNDYFGFFPLKKEQFRLKGLERFSPEQIDQLSRDCDLAYYTDTYGVYTNEWYGRKNQAERSGIIYGGMSQQDIDFLKRMKERKKLIITEFNSIGSPTADETRAQFEQLFGIKWSGWIGRFFNSLDTNLNKEIPRWLIKDYKLQHKGQWSFKLSGIAFVSNSGQVIILEEEKHLNNPLPYIETSPYGQRVLGLPKSMKYSFWFDIIEADPSVNNIVSAYQLDVNKQGEEELRKNGLPSSIPAVTMHKDDKDYEFYYFSGDFCDSPISYSSSHFKGIDVFKGLFYKENDLLERKSFFWKFYRPMVSAILNNYYKKKER